MQIQDNPAQPISPQTQKKNLQLNLYLKMNGTYSYKLYKDKSNWKIY